MTTSHTSENQGRQILHPMQSRETLHKLRPNTTWLQCNIFLATATVAEMCATSLNPVRESTQGKCVQSVHGTGALLSPACAFNVKRQRHMVAS